MSKALNAFYAAGRAIGLAEIGAPADVSIRDIPSMSPIQVATTVAGGHFRVDLPVVSDTGDEVLPLIAGSEAVKSAVSRGDVRPDRAALERLVGGSVIEIARHIRALADATSPDIARERSDQVAERAGALVKWRWHAIKKLAEMLRTRRALSDAEVRSLIGA